ncbi:MAG: TonB-dependent receptor, partial [Sphingomonadales bacterium]
DVRDFQANVQNGQFGTVRGYLANAEKVRTRGVEVDFSIRPSERFSAYTSGAFTDARYVRFCDAPPPPELSGGSTTLASTGPCTYSGTPSAPGTPGGASPPFVDASGQRLPGVSKWAFAYGAEANQPATLLDTQGQLYFGYDASYRSSWSSNPTPSAYTWVNGYALHNFRTGFRTAKFDAFIWVRNAFDRNFIDFYTAGTGGNTGLIVAQVGDPRTFGGTVKLVF